MSVARSVFFSTHKSTKGDTFTIIKLPTKILKSLTIFCDKGLNCNKICILTNLVSIPDEFSTLVKTDQILVTLVASRELLTTATVPVCEDCEDCENCSVRLCELISTGGGRGVDWRSGG